MKRISIHVGLNQVDPRHYGGPMPLRGCLNDARAMDDLCAAAGIQRRHLLADSHATSDRVLGRIRAAAEELDLGDLLVVTYAGHGGILWDENGDERDGIDETWCLYDRMVADDELYALWTRFRAGVRILLISDSCHSGTVARLIARTERAREHGDPWTVRSIPAETAQGVYRAHAAAYDGIRARYAAEAGRPLQASVILVSACLDREVTLDRPTNGVFTEALLRVWDAGRFTGDHRDFHARIYESLRRQRPGYLMLGVPDPAFERSRPFGAPEAASIVPGPRLDTAADETGPAAPQASAA